MGLSGARSVRGEAAPVAPPRYTARDEDYLYAIGLTYRSQLPSASAGGAGPAFAWSVGFT